MRKFEFLVTARWTQGKELSTRPLIYFGNSPKHCEEYLRIRFGPEATFKFVKELS